MKIRIVIGLLLLLIGGALTWRLDVLADQRDDALQESAKWEDRTKSLSQVLASEREEALMVEGEMLSYREKIKELESIEKETIVEVTEYVIDTEVPECGVDSEWVRLYNKSGGASVSRTSEDTTGTDGDSGRVYPAQSIIGTVVQNNMSCQKEKEKIIALQSIIEGIYSARGLDGSF